MKARATKRALISSALVLALCLSMFVGTTFAWFTDSVTSGTNRIIAGNLDVELEHKTAGGNFESVTNTENTLWQTPAFSGPTLWEPGAMAVETFRVSNVGTLALKYALTVNPLTAADYSKVTWANDATERDLTDVIKMVITDAAPATREAGKALFTTAATKTIGKTEGIALQTSALEPGVSKEFTVILYWPETNTNEFDNKYNLNNTGWNLYSPASASSAITAHDTDDTTKDYLYIQPSVTLLATQQTSESDSFDNQYDASANNGTSSATDVTVSSSSTQAIT